MSDVGDISAVRGIISARAVRIGIARKYINVFLKCCHYSELYGSSHCRSSSRLPIYNILLRSGSIIIELDNVIDFRS